MTQVSGISASRFYVAEPKVIFQQNWLDDFLVRINAQGKTNYKNANEIIKDVFDQAKHGSIDARGAIDELLNGDPANFRKRMMDNFRTSLTDRSVDLLISLSKENLAAKESDLAQRDKYVLDWAENLINAYVIDKDAIRKTYGSQLKDLGITAKPDNLSVPATDKSYKEALRKYALQDPNAKPAPVQKSSEPQRDTGGETNMPQSERQPASGDETPCPPQPDRGERNDQPCFQSGGASKTLTPQQLKGGEVNSDQPTPRDDKVQPAEVEQKDTGGEQPRVWIPGPPSGPGVNINNIYALLNRARVVQDQDGKQAVPVINMQAIPVTDTLPGDRSKAPGSPVGSDLYPRDRKLIENNQGDSPVTRQQVDPSQTQVKEELQPLDKFLIETSNRSYEKLNPKEVEGVQELLGNHGRPYSSVDQIISMLYLKWTLIRDPKSDGGISNAIAALKSNDEKPFKKLMKEELGYLDSAADKKKAEQLVDDYKLDKEQLIKKFTPSSPEWNQPDPGKGLKP